MEALYKDYRDKGVAFNYIYKNEAHPGFYGYEETTSMEERLRHVKAANKEFGIRIPWLVDDMENSIKNAYGKMSNSEFLISPEGRILKKRAWGDPETLRQELTEFVGPVKNPTRPVPVAAAEDPEGLGPVMPRDRPDPKYYIPSTGLVKLLPRPSLDQLLRVVAKPKQSANNEPYYAKVRVEMTPPRLSRGGQGKMFIVLGLDKSYGVHWNNLTRPLQVRLRPSKGLLLERDLLTGPKLKVVSDSDPREFLIAFTVEDDAALKQPLGIDVSYFACDDKLTWCVLFNQSHEADISQLLQQKIEPTQ